MGQAWEGQGPGVPKFNASPCELAEVQIRALSIYVQPFITF